MPLIIIKIVFNECVMCIDSKNDGRYFGRKEIIDMMLEKIKISTISCLGRL